MEIDIHNQTIFIAPLDWGLGHTTRCVPIIHELLKNNNQVILGCAKLSEPIFEEEFPQLIRVPVPEYGIEYSKVLPVWLSLLFQFPRFKKIIKEENDLLNTIITKHKISVVISDNRYGLFNSKVRSIFVCHQINLKTPFLQKSVNSYHHQFLKHFNEIWVPDYENRNLSLAGDLSTNKLNLNCKYIGPLSRLRKIELPKSFDFLFLLSGPEPQQTQLLATVIKKAQENKLNAAIVTSSLTIPKTELTIYQLPKKELLNNLIAQSETIICRSGYSTLMDLHTLQENKLILIPTKGQSEQEYLAQHWQKTFQSINLPEDQFESYQIKKE